MLCNFVSCGSGSVFFFLLVNHTMSLCSSTIHIPHQDPDWRVRLKNFDEVFRPSSSTESERVPTQADAEVDLAKEGATATTAAKSSLHVECDPPPSLTKEEFEKKYPDIGATITLSVSGQNILCQYVDGKVFLSSATKTRAPGVASSSPTPLFLYAGGQWIGESSKAHE